MLEEACQQAAALVIHIDRGADRGLGAQVKVADADQLRDGADRPGVDATETTSRRPKRAANGNPGGRRRAMRWTNSTSYGIARNPLRDGCRDLSARLASQLRGRAL